jgi:hypothetical protein
MMMRFAMEDPGEAKARMIRRSNRFVTGRDREFRASRGYNCALHRRSNLPMEAEQVNQIQTSLSSLSVRAAELRRYL